MTQDQQDQVQPNKDTQQQLDQSTAGLSTGVDAAKPTTVDSAPESSKTSVDQRNEEASSAQEKIGVRYPADTPFESPPVESTKEFQLPYTMETYTQYISTLPKSEPQSFLNDTNKILQYLQDNPTGKNISDFTREELLVRHAKLSFQLLFALWKRNPDSSLAPIIGLLSGINERL